MRLSYSTLTLLEQAGDEAAAVITRAWNAEAGWLLDSPHIRIHYLTGPECYTLEVEVAYHHLQARRIVAPARWSRMWEDRSHTALPIEQTMLQASRCAPYTYNPNTLDYDYPEME